jgi:hypothetical protein
MSWKVCEPAWRRGWRCTISVSGSTSNSVVLGWLSLICWSGDLNSHQAFNAHYSVPAAHLDRGAEGGHGRQCDSAAKTPYHLDSPVLRPRNVRQRLELYSHVHIGLAPRHVQAEMISLAFMRPHTEELERRGVDGTRGQGPLSTGTGVAYGRPVPADLGIRLLQMYRLGALCRGPCCRRRSAGRAPSRRLSLLISPIMYLPRPTLPRGYGRPV